MPTHSFSGEPAVCRTHRSFRITTALPQSGFVFLSWILTGYVFCQAPPPPLPEPSEQSAAEAPASQKPVDLPILLPWGLTVGLLGLLILNKYPLGRPQRNNQLGQESLGVSQSIADALKEAKETAESANRAKDEFLAALSHELRSPLNPVLLLASEYARSTDLPLRLREDFQIILKNVRLQARLIDDLLDLNRIQRGGISISARRLNLKTVLSDACEGIQSEAQERDVRIQVECPQAECMIRGDTTRLHQILGNVLRNAIKFAPRQTSVTARLTLSASIARVTISDCGPGIPTEDIARIFSPFVQALRPGVHPGTCGLGLGLAIAQRLVERHRGRIWAESDGPGKGAHFHVELPLEPLDPTCPPTSDAEGVAKDLHPTNEPLRILLLEDHDFTRNVLLRMLQRHGFETFSAASIDAASRILSTDRVDILISDLGLPDGDGFKLPVLWKTQILFGCIALSGFGMEHDVARSLECGFERHLTKPVEFSTLLEAIETLRKAHTGKASANNPP